MGGVKIWSYGLEEVWDYPKYVINLGSTPPGGAGLAAKGWQKAFTENQGNQPAAWPQSVVDALTQVTGKN